MGSGVPFLLIKITHPIIVSAASRLQGFNSATQLHEQDVQKPFRTRRKGQKSNQMPILESEFGSILKWKVNIRPYADGLNTQPIC
jgi:hypothetical protein